MLSFKKMELVDREILEPYFKKSGFMGSAYCFGLNYIWRKSINPYYAIAGDFAIMRFGNDSKYTFTFPAGDGDIKECIDELIKYTQEEGIQLKISAEKSVLGVFEQYYPDMFEVKENRDYFDYIYDSKKLATLSGKKYHSKRNHVTRFFNQGGVYEEITAENIKECEEMSREWCKLYGCGKSESLQEEYCAVKQCFDNFFTLGMKGGLLRLNGRVVAFCIGEEMNEREFIVHVEKAYHEVEGAYAAINNCFAKTLFEKYEYINREDDTGDEGLRKAKLSYKPEILLEKYTLTLK